LLAPFAETARLCGMEYLPPFVIHGCRRLSEPAVLAARAQEYATLLMALRDNAIPRERLMDARYLNDCLPLTVVNEASA
jgi:glutathione-regulated potassium-efflux system ancillary protein KefG